MQVLFQQFNLGEGLNRAVSEYLLKPGECQEALGCDFSNVGELARIPGYESYGSGLDVASVTGLYDFKTAGGVSKWIAKTSTSLFYDNSGSWTTATGGGALTSGEKASFATHLDTLIVGSASDAPRKSTNGTDFSTLGGSPPTAKYWLTFDNKVYALNLSGNRSRIRWSDDGTIETWTSTNIQDVITNIGVGDEITGGTVNNNTLLIFKNYSTWKWDTYELRVIHASAGCRAPDSIATIDDWTFWLSHKGIMATNGGKPFRISKKAKPFTDAISDITAPVGWAEDNFYYLYIGTVSVTGIGSITNCVLIYDYDNDVISYKSMPDAVTKAAVLTTSGNVRSSYFGNDAGQVYKFRTGIIDNATAISFKWVGGPQMSGYAHLQKDYEYFYVMLNRTAKSGIDVFFSVDFGAFKQLGTAKDVISELAFPPGTSGHNIRIAYETNTTADQQKILGHVCLGDIQPGRLGNVQ